MTGNQMKYKDLTPEDKARSQFFSKMDWEGGLECMYDHNSFKGFDLPADEQAVFDNLAAALNEARKLTAKYMDVNESVEFDDDET